MNKKGQFGSVEIPVITIIAIFVAFFLMGDTFLGYFGLAKKTVSAQNFEKNYEYFKSQETAMKQLEAQICQSKNEVNDFKEIYGNSTTWTKTTKQEYSELAFIKNGYISKYNSLVADYNAKRSSFIQNFGRDDKIPYDYALFYEAQCGAA